VAANPLAHVFQAVGEPLPLVEYDTWNVILPEGEFLTRVGAFQFLEVLEEVNVPFLLFATLSYYVVYVI
jgi:hypothetical protein